MSFIPFIQAISLAVIRQPLHVVMMPELILGVVACVSFLIGCSSKTSARRLAPILALAALAAVFFLECSAIGSDGSYDQWGTFRVFPFAHYIKMITAGVGFMLALLAWPSNRDATGNSALNFGQESGEFFGLLLLSIAGVFLVAGANDMILLFLGIELASIPTYVMVSISRPLPAAQEAGVKYFFLGALAAALMLFGFSYLYGTTGQISLSAIETMWHPEGGALMLSSWNILAVLMLVAGFAFKMAAVPLHFYAGDVYQGAATPVTAFLSFVPKTSGFVALVKILYVVGGPSWAVPHSVAKLLLILAVLTMTAGNVLGLLQYNIKRLLAYSSIAHSGYMLVGIAALTAGGAGHRSEGLEAVLFYLAAYGIMNAGAFAVLMLLPADEHLDHGYHGPGPTPATSAETFEDIAGLGRRHITLGLCMAVSCFSLIGMPLTVGFIGKVYLVRAALNNVADHNHMVALAIILVINAAISAGYYLRIVGTMFLRAHATHLGEVPHGEARITRKDVQLPSIARLEAAMEQGTEVATPARGVVHSGARLGGGKSALLATGRMPARPPFAIVAALFASVAGTLFFGISLPGASMLGRRASDSVVIDAPVESAPATEAPAAAQADRVNAP